MKNHVELLAPAGSYEAFAAAINAGADAIYVGGNKFNAREYANNFDKDELVSAIESAHLRGVKVYLTLNTLFKNKEISEVSDFLEPYYEAGLDAVLVQDIGVLKHIRERFPLLPIHSSTQMSISDVYGAKLLKSMGVSRIVTARELSLKEIERIRKEADIEVETFVHGALCYSYSGRCLMSSMLGGRSGNRGRCAGTCRLPFNKDGKEFYPLSMKDLCTIEILPELIDAGIDSLKIEGRMKSGEYVAGVVSLYRKYLDKILNGEEYRVDKSDIEALLDLGNRTGFTDGYYKIHNGREMITFDSPSHVNAGEKVLKERYGHLACGKINKIKVSGEASFKANNEIRLTLHASLNDKEYLASASGPITQPAEKAPVSEESIKEKICVSGDNDLEISSVDIDLDDGLFVNVKAIKELRREALKDLKDNMLASYKREEVKGESRLPEHGTGKAEPGSGLTYSVYLNSQEQLDAALSFDGINRIYAESIKYEINDLKAFERDVVKDVKAVHDNNGEFFFVMPQVFRCADENRYKDMIRIIKDAGADGFMVSSYDSLAFLLDNDAEGRDIVTDTDIYALNDIAKETLKSLGIVHDTVPYELNKKEISHRDNRGSEITIYGRIPLMYSANCLHKNTKGCDKNKTFEKMTDRKGKTFIVRNDCNTCTNILYNADILDLTGDIPDLKSFGIEGFRLRFTEESREETSGILDAFLSGQDLLLKDFTKGHYKRGVE